MSQPIIKAVAKFLGRALEPATAVEQAKVYTQCAKDLLDELIESNEEPKAEFKVDLEDLVENAPSPEEPKPAPRPPSKPLEDPHKDDYVIEVDKLQQLVKIKNLPLDAVVALDDIEMLHKDAIGKKFKRGAIIDDGS